MSRIIYVNQKLLHDPRLREFLGNYNYDWNSFLGVSQWNPGVEGIYVRAGTNTLPLKNDLVHEMNMGMPAYDPGFAMTFEEITDLRVTTLRQNLWNRPWIVKWSGGIDSVVIVTSILKNLPRQDWANIKIACNRVSVYEHPKFFYDHILPNFSVIDSNHLELNSPELNNYYTIVGEPADQLYGGYASRGFLGESVTKNWRTDPDELINMFTRAVDKKFAQWFYEVTRANIESVDVPVETYYDFFWWLFFNFFWMPVRLRSLHFQTDINVDNFNLYMQNFIHFFNTEEYQRWSLVNRLGTKYAVNIAHRKLASKQYIYNFDHDEYYYRFKTKMESMSLRTFAYDKTFCLLDDHTRLNLDRDLDQILTLLPEHIIV